MNNISYTDYNKTGDYHVRVAITGKIVTVSGIIFGKGTAGYVTEVILPTPFGFVPNDSEYIANAVIFYARNQQTGAIQQMRAGGNFFIYRETAMTNGQPYAFGFSYCID